MTTPPWTFEGLGHRLHVLETSFTKSCWSTKLWDANRIAAGFWCTAARTIDGSLVFEGKGRSLPQEHACHQKWVGCHRCLFLGEGSCIILSTMSSKHKTAYRIYLAKGVGHWSFLKLRICRNKTGSTKPMYDVSQPIAAQEHFAKMLRTAKPGAPLYLHGETKLNHPNIKLDSISTLGVGSHVGSCPPTLSLPMYGGGKPCLICRINSSKLTITRATVFRDLKYRPLHLAWAYKYAVCLNIINTNWLRYEVLIVIWWFQPLWKISVKMGIFPK